MKFQKYQYQSIINIVRQLYGNDDYLFQFCSDVNITNTDEFENLGHVIDIAKLPVSNVSSYCINNSYAIVDNIQEDYVKDIVYNDDMTFKSVINGSFGNDFNNDFDIQTPLQIITVGYNGMTLNVVFSITNNGTKSEIVTGTVQVGATIINWSVNIGSGETETVSVSFPNLLEGTYDVILTSDTFSDIQQILVLGSPNFVCNNDLHIIEPYYAIGDNITLVWSVTNTGEAGRYSGFSYYLNTPTLFEPTIQKNQTYTFTQTVNVSQTTFDFRDTCNNRITILVSEAPPITNSTFTYFEEGNIWKGIINTFGGTFDIVQGANVQTFTTGYHSITIDPLQPIVIVGEISGFTSSDIIKDITITYNSFITIQCDLAAGYLILNSEYSANLLFYHNTFTQDNIDNILIQMDSSIYPNTGVIDLRSNTGITPSATGLIAKDSLIAKGWNVFTS